MRPSIFIIQAIQGLCTLGLILGLSVTTLYSQSPQEHASQDLSLALKRIERYHATEPVPSQRTLQIVYWTPKDRKPIVEYRERLTRVMFHIRSFFLREMSRLGMGDKTISLAVESDGLLKIHFVQGREPYANYDVESGSKIRDECLPVLESAGIDAEKETIVIFCNMSNWDPIARKMSQNSPYYAGGGLRKGTAWQVDSALLDANLLDAKHPMLEDGQYGHISVGKYNSIFVGGVCHELGHALGLPHNLESPVERKRRGTSLMGSGNRTYGDELRREGRGTFLSLADGLRLASHPLFTANEKGIDLPASAMVTNVAIEVAGDSKSFQISGRVVADPPAYAVLAYIDPNDGSDYDAMTVVAIPDSNQEFVLPCSLFKNAKAHELRIVVCQVNGGRIDDCVHKVPFTVDANGIVDVSSYLTITKLARLSAAVGSDDPEAVARELGKLEQGSSQRNKLNPLLEIARSLASSIDFKPGPSPSEAQGPSCWLSDSTAKVAKVGWLRPTVNRLPQKEALLSVGSQAFARGLYAHAPSIYTYDLGSRWKRLSGFAGLADGHEGTVEFLIVGDGKELWRSKKSRESTLVDFSLSVEGVHELTLQVDNAGDGNGADWGVWADVKLDRR